ncbi:Alanine racemase [Azospirillaceae bacterium]
MSDEHSAPTVLTIDVSAIVANWRTLHDVATTAQCAAVVKANAYGLGVARVAPALIAAGCDAFFVATPDEALMLRALSPQVEIFCLNGLLPGVAPDFVRHRITPVLNQLDEIIEWRARARQLHSPLSAIIHIDTGMNRLGLSADERRMLADDPDSLSGVTIRAWLSHLACADDAGDGLTPTQLGRFRLALGGLPPAPASLANSSGVFRGRPFHFDMVRPGCALYGVNPTPETDNPMRPVVRWQARVLQVRSVDAPMTVGYGAAYPVSRPGRLATIAVGYADGYPRALSERASVYVYGENGLEAIVAPVVGRISMDLTTIDVSDLPEGAVRPGMLVELIGSHHSVDQLAQEAGTIGYEILTGLGARSHRIYVEAA